MVNFDLIISGCTTLESDTQFQALCSSWSVDGYEHQIKIITDAEGRNKLYKSIVPGAIETIDTIVRKPYYYDSTWMYSSNTLFLKYATTNPDISTISSMRFSQSGLENGIYLGVSSYSEKLISPTVFQITFSGYIVETL